MKLPVSPVNPCLFVLLRGSGFPSLDQFATAVNRYGARRYGLDLKYDHSSVKRWLRGSSCEHHEVVAGVLGEAWGVPIPSGVIWPHTRDDPAWTIAHFLPCVAARAVEDLAVFVRSDLLASRVGFADAVVPVTGNAFVQPLDRWLATPPYRLPLVEVDDGPSIDPATVDEFERATLRFVGLDAAVGGSAVRDAAVGLLKPAVDLLERDGRDDPAGNRMLAAVARLAGEIGAMSEDAGMPGPAQKYLVYAVQAARASADPRGPLTAVAVLTDLARQQGNEGQPEAGLRVLDLAFERIATGKNGCGPIRAVLWSVKASLLAQCGAARRAEALHAAELAVDLHSQTAGEDGPGLFRHSFGPDVHRHVAGAYLNLVKATDPEDAAAVNDYARRAAAAADTALGLWPEPAARERACAHIDRACARFVLDDVDGACEDAEHAVTLTNRVIGSVTLRTRLRDLLDAAHRHRAISRVTALRTEITRAAHPRAQV